MRCSAADGGTSSDSRRRHEGGVTEADGLAGVKSAGVIWEKELGRAGDVHSGTGEAPSRGVDGVRAEGGVQLAAV